MVQFKTGFSLLISRLSFISNLNLLESDAMQLHCSRESGIANSLVFLIRFPNNFEVAMHLLKKMAKRLSVTSYLGVTTRIAVYYSRLKFFLRESLNLNKLSRLQVDLKTTLQNWITIWDWNFLLQESLNLNKLSRLQVDLKTTLQNWIFLLNRSPQMCTQIQRRVPWIGQHGH